MLVPVTFKNNDTATEKFKTGKVSTQTARMLYANTFSGKVGIVKGYKKDKNTDELSLIGGQKEQGGSMWRLKFNKGAVSIYGGVGIIEQDTFTDFIVPNNITNYSFGIKVDLGETGQQQMNFYCKPSSEALVQQDLQINDVDGIYEFELFKITTTGENPTTSSKTDKYILSVSDYLKKVGFNGDNILDGANNVVGHIERHGGAVIGTIYENFGSAIINSEVILPEIYRPEIQISFGCVSQIYVNATGVGTAFNTGGETYKYTFYPDGRIILQESSVNAQSGSGSQRINAMAYAKNKSSCNFGYKARPIIEE